MSVRSILVALAPMLVVAWSSPAVAQGRVPSRSEVARALIVAMTCWDYDGLTHCDVRLPVAVRFTRLHCEPQRAYLPNAIAQASCRFSARIKWRYPGGRVHWAEPPGNAADFWLPKGDPDVPQSQWPNWTAIGELYWRDR